MYSDETNGFKVDLNRVTRREFREFVSGLSEVNRSDQDNISAGFIEKVVVEWPYDVPISADSYLDMGLLDSQVVDKVVESALDDISKKK